MGGMLGQATTSAGGENDFGDNMYDVPVEIYGIVYVYNPPNRKMLALEDEVINASIQESGDANAPVTAGDNTAPATAPPAAE